MFPVADEFLAALREREASHDHPEARRRFALSYTRLIEQVQHAETVDRDRTLVCLREGFADAQSTFEFGCLANTCGQIVEIGADPTIALDPILDRVTHQLARVRELVSVMQQHLHIEHPNQVVEQDWDSLGRAHPEHAWVIGDWFALRFIGGAAMTMLCRDVAARKSARMRVDLVQNAEAARSDNPYAYYLAETLGLVDDERLLVLDTQRRLQFGVHLTAIRNNFHLFTLLQDALQSHPSARDWHGPRVRPAIIAVAKGERMMSDVSANEWAAEGAWHDGRVMDSALWDIGSARTPPTWIWGEEKPTEIPERSIVLRPLEMARSWDIAFFTPLHPALRSAVVVEAVHKMV